MNENKQKNAVRIEQCTPVPNFSSIEELEIFGPNLLKKMTKNVKK